MLIIETCPKMYEAKIETTINIVVDNVFTSLIEKAKEIFNEKYPNSTILDIYEVNYR